MGNTNKTLNLDSVSTTLKRIAELAKKLNGKPILTLAHHIYVPLLNPSSSRCRFIPSSRSYSSATTPDVAAGRLDAFAAEALAEYERGETTDL